MRAARGQTTCVQYSAKLGQKMTRQKQLRVVPISANEG